MAGMGSLYSAMRAPTLRDTRVSAIEILPDEKLRLLHHTPASIATVGSVSTGKFPDFRRNQQLDTHETLQLAFTR